MIYLSEESIPRGVVVTGLAAVIEAELKRQGKNWAWLSRETDIAESTFTKWKQGNFDTAPELDMLARVAGKLGMSLRPLIEALGYPVDESVEYADRQARARALVAAIPRLAEVAERLAKLKPEDQDGIMDYITFRLQQIQQRHQGRKE